MSLFLPITKVDAAQRLVYGTISEEVPDKAGEILDYESAKPAFLAWSDQFHAASGGKSLGNVRAMHGGVAAGKLTDIHFDDANRRIEGVAKIIDDKEWHKVTEGVYTGFSIGGGYARRWPDAENPHLMRYTPVLTEVSLVDNPAVPTATFQLIKQDGTVELRKFDAKPAAESPERNALLTGLAWLKAHAEGAGAAGLLVHIAAIAHYLAAPATETAEKYMQPAGDLRERVETLQKRVAELEAQPMPAKGALRVVGKYDDRVMPETESPVTDAAEKIRLLMKTALSNPIAM